MLVGYSGYRTSHSIHELVFEKVERIAKTERSPNKIKISIDTSQIVSAGLFQTVLMHELGHALYNRRDLTGDIMDFTYYKTPWAGSISMCLITTKPLTTIHLPTLMETGQLFKNFIKLKKERNERLGDHLHVLGLFLRQLRFRRVHGRIYCP